MKENNITKKTGDDNMNWIEKFAIEIFKSYSFDINFFHEARTKVEMYIENEIKYIEFDKTCFGIYKSNLSQEEKKQIFKIVSMLWKDKNSEIIKERNERFTLFNYMLINFELQKYKIKKESRPDFVLEDENQKIGIEVTRLTNEQFEVAKVILAEASENISLEQFRKVAIKRHGKKAQDYRYHKINEKFAISSGGYSCDEMIKEYVNEINKKYKKYKDDLGKYDKFIILCDATAPIELTEEQEIDNMINQLPFETFDKAFYISVLYSGENKGLKEFLISTNNIKEVNPYIS